MWLSKKMLNPKAGWNKGTKERMSWKTKGYFGMTFNRPSYLILRQPDIYLTHSCLKEPGQSYPFGEVPFINAYFGEIFEGEIFIRTNQKLPCKYFPKWCMITKLLILIILIIKNRWHNLRQIAPKLQQKNDIFWSILREY